MEVIKLNLKENKILIFHLIKLYFKKNNLL